MPAGFLVVIAVRFGAIDGIPEIALFFAQQGDFVEMVQGEGAGQALQRMGQLLGLSPQRLEQCLTDEPYMMSLVEDLQQNMAADNVQSTPTFIINGEAHAGNRPVEAFAALIEEHL